MITRVAAALCVMTGVAAADVVTIGPGTYRPMFPTSPSEREVPVAKFALDRTAVTNRDFLAFVRERPEWQRDRVKRLVADDRYLSHWASPTDLGTSRPTAPVVRVSWFAARAYCAWRGGRLPLEKEWELAAAANATTRDASKDPAFQEAIVAWYTEVAPATLPDVGRTTNAWGAQDLHGLVWEWIEDFNASLVSDDSRTPNRSVFCGAAGATSRDPSAYATFMRVVFRSSLSASFTTSALGFRCAYDLENKR